LVEHITRDRIVNAQTVILSRRYHDADPAFGCTEETAAARIVRVFAEKLDASGDPVSEHHAIINTRKPVESGVSPVKQRLLAPRFVVTHAGGQEP
jgi:hypothetical protein